MTSSLRTMIGSAPSTTAPIANSDCIGTPILRTRMRSSGACRAAATSAATGTPPRGSARMTGRWSAYRLSAFASFFPASHLSLKDIATSLRALAPDVYVRDSGARIHSKVALEPARGSANHGFQRPRLGEKVAGAWNNLERLWAPQPG